MIIVKCNGCGKQMWDALSQQEIEALVHEAINAMCTNCLVYGKLYYNPAFGDDKICRCGHKYYRHYDTYEDMAPVGCKYCECERFKS
jgi:hypothetical protein